MKCYEAVFRALQPGMTQNDASALADAAYRRLGFPGYVSVQVGDTGPGIPKGTRSIIFKEFQRLEATAGSVRGLGLGLSIVERIGKVLDHPVALESVPGRGSVFSVDMPRAAPSAATLSPEPPDSRPAGGVHRQRARGPAGHAGPARRLGLQRHNCARFGRRPGAAADGDTTAGYHPGRLPP